MTRTLPESISPHPFFARMPVKYITCCMVMRRASDHAPALSVVSLSFLNKSSLYLDFVSVHLCDVKSVRCT